VRWVWWVFRLVHGCFERHEFTVAERGHEIGQQVLGGGPWCLHQVSSTSGRKNPMRLPQVPGSVRVRATARLMVKFDTARVGPGNLWKLTQPSLDWPRSR